ncbi:MAG TPA: extracellular solute-binding protein [Bradyrhizobium sp.]|uniref:ABC transporter substrate-binding protein n=1 Tax=Bradyrhizobium sp. TaxID=376 RepID=UPI002BD13F96|nr:extracellular solute-binding protein [Bradyrhizobium sp.]HTA99774.1 extracellular solute-binding protein [Bradyrhizobium sp.]
MASRRRGGLILISRRAALLGLAAGSALLSAPPTARAEDEWNKIVADAKKEGHVVLYSAFVGLAAHQELKKDFETSYGITVDILEARASEVRERIRIEQAAGRFAADVSENGRTTTTLQIAQDHVFDPFGPLPSLGHLKPEFRGDDIRLPVFAIVYGILASTRLVKPEDEPKSWLDLADAKWKGKILSDDFRALGGGGVLFYVLEEHFGRDFHEKLAQQDIKFSREIPANERRIARGELPLYLPVSLTSIPELKGLPVKFIAPKEGLPYIGYDLALLKNAPHPNAARLLMEHYLGQKMQQGFANLGLLPVTSDTLSELDPAVADLQKSKLLGTTDAARMDKMLALAKQIYP